MMKYLLMVMESNGAILYMKHGKIGIDGALSSHRRVRDMHMRIRVEWSVTISFHGNITSYIPSADPHQAIILLPPTSLG